MVGQTLPLLDRADLVVCGGGTAGAFCALAAAEAGADVLLVEQFGSLGGSATN
ncbi:MAG: FAD-dependent oxidoreductase, partial [Oscillospiraceae bacterium]|nr:FAD-dependent oxidoreductase [Oscillospiraceae bacterium]